MILVHCHPSTLAREFGAHPNLGVLMCPAKVYPTAQATFSWAADNRAYTEWEPERYRRMLKRITGWPRCLFVTAPDVVADSSSTLERFELWETELRRTGQPIALVAQDGMTSTDVPWSRLGALFIGGTTGWKLGWEAAELAAETRARGLHLHMGRVNTHRRIRYAKALGCDSIDGTNFSKFRTAKLPRALELAGEERQLAVGSTA